MMQMPPRNLSKYALMLALLALASDQISKFWVLTSAMLENGMRITPFLDFILVWNKGISYGLFDQDSTGGQAVLIALSLLIIGFLLWLLRNATTRLNAYGLGLVIGGAAGNIIDRILHGAVVDFISLHTQNYAWYVFNLADIWITLGVILILCDTLRQPNTPEDTPTNTPE